MTSPWTSWCERRVAGLRLALLDDGGAEVPPMDAGAVRDMGNRYFPVHLDLRLSEEGWWHGPERYSRREPRYTFDRDRPGRDARRERQGTPADHRLPGPDDSPEGRRVQRRRAARRRAAEETERRLRAGELPPVEPWVCDCPPRCAELEDWHGPPRHAPECPCGCDPCRPGRTGNLRRVPVAGWDRPVPDPEPCERSPR